MASFQFLPPQLRLDYLLAPLGRLSLLGALAEVIAARTSLRGSAVSSTSWSSVILLSGSGRARLASTSCRQTDYQD